MKRSFLLSYFFLFIFSRCTNFNEKKYNDKIDKYRINVLENAYEFSDLKEHYGGVRYSAQYAIVSISKYKIDCKHVDFKYLYDFYYEKKSGKLVKGIGVVKSDNLLDSLKCCKLSSIIFKTGTTYFFSDCSGNIILQPVLFFKSEISEYFVFVKDKTTIGDNFKKIQSVEKIRDSIYLYKVISDKNSY